jgi:hypothetical protein
LKLSPQTQWKEYEKLLGEVPSWSSSSKTTSTTPTKSNFEKKEFSKGEEPNISWSLEKDTNKYMVGQ